MISTAPLFSDNFLRAAQNAARYFVWVEVHRQQGAGDLKIERVQRMVCAFAAVSNMAAISVSAGISTLHAADAVSGSPFARQDATVNVISRSPDSGETKNQSEFVTLLPG